MNIQFVPGDRLGCGYYRIVQPATVIKSLTDNKVSITEGDIYPRDCTDIIYMQRATSRNILKQWPKIKKYYPNIRMICDYDDILWNYNGQSVPKYNLCSRSINVDDNTEAMKKYLEVFDYITVSTEMLKNSIVETFNYPVDRIHVIPNMFSKSRWYFNSDNNKYGVPEIGLAMSNTHYDPVSKKLGDFTTNLVDWFNLQDHINVMGNEMYFLKNGRYTDWCPIEYYPNQFNYWNVNLYIAPLKDNVFNQCKSDLKFMECCATGKLFIGSDFKDSPYSNIDDRCKIHQYMTVNKIDEVVMNAWNNRYEIIQNQYKSIRWLEDNIDMYLKLFK